MLNFPIKNNKVKQKFNAGFTLIELLVTIVIFVVLTGVVLFKQNGFDSTILLSNFAYDVAITIRQAQSYGLNQKEAINSEVFSSYGVYFNTAVNDKSFIFFADTMGEVAGFETVPDQKFNGDSDCPVYDPECIQKYTIKRGNFISKLCVGDSSSACTETEELSILFKYPEPDALINIDDMDGTSENYAEVEISSSNGNKRKIVITEVGQIYVKKN